MTSRVRDICDALDDFAERSDRMGIRERLNHARRLAKVVAALPADEQAQVAAYLAEQEEQQEATEAIAALCDATTPGEA